MRIIVSVPDGRVGLCVGYGPGKGGRPKAIVLFPDGTFSDFSLSQIIAAEMGSKTRRRIARRLGIDTQNFSTVNH